MRIDMYWVVMENANLYVLGGYVKCESKCIGWLCKMRIGGYIQVLNAIRWLYKCVFGWLY